MTIKATKLHCYICFETIVQQLSQQKSREIWEAESDSCPLFVTWDISTRRWGSSQYQLRGCIGTFASKPLNQSLREYATTSAFRDSRFEPITLKEVPLLKCSVNLLTCFEGADNYLDWEIGTHGIQIAFADQKTRRHGTYLPKVAVEQGWTKREAIESLIRKAGYRGSITEELLGSLEVTRYQSSEIGATYSEYQSFLEGQASE
ncbi:AMMECR1 domain-containing protein [Polychytrium aggregatum]|uniref:AMMECR1 domain-containing protein n=1 Tax=Polychytrium aggregatum TaxID=110093 RepID=UPI0022FE7141|nr:AMMECR1 domain-containing protein [Polychytrium aggregatum]KAI9204681.1 AMMECR1 domain-containing protein [Polychytrium aggregatum]